MTDRPPPARRPAEQLHAAPGDGRRGPHATTIQSVYPHEMDKPAEGDTVLLTAPRDGTPRPVSTPEGFSEAVTRLAGGTGPVAVDAERASGYRYSHRAYLVQLRRAGAGTVLVDPIRFDDLTALASAIDDAEWVLHAASQDLACLAELGLRPRRLFDTELAARIVGFDRVGLAALTERLLGYSLEKHHSAADWSTRPLPQSWLTYAALDVELLVELRYALGTELERQGKLAWAEEEFAALLTADGARPRPDPWRRTSGIHKVRGSRALARVRALWEARDEIARRRDLAPGRVLPDAAIVTAAAADPQDEATLLALPGWNARSTRRLVRVWLRVLGETRTLTDTGLPPVTVPSEGPPPPHRWPERDPVAAARLARARQAVVRLAAERALPPENLIAPDAVRRLAWSPPDPVTPQTVAAVLAGYGARRWQVALIADDLAAALAAAP